MKPESRLLSLTGSFLLSYLIVSLPTQAQMDIGSDSTMSKPTHVDFDKNNNSFIITGGTSAGSNLFHSFANFSVPEGTSAIFINDNGNIHNVIGRVTGINPSWILGQLRAEGSAPNFNLFLLNPNGIIFGSTASLSLNGSFVATTADSIQFGNKGFFSASIQNDPALLTINPSAFIFNRLRNNPISHQLAELNVPNGNSLVLLGGDIKSEGGTLTVPNGRVELGGLAGDISNGYNLITTSF